MPAHVLVLVLMPSLLCADLFSMHVCIHAAVEMMKYSWRVHCAAEQTAQAVRC